MSPSRTQPLSPIPWESPNSALGESKSPSPRAATQRAGAGDSGYGEGGPALAPEIAEARAIITARRATESEFARAKLAHLPALEAAVNNAMLDLTCRTKKVPIYQYLSGSVRFKARLLAQLEGTDENSIAPSPEQAKWQGFLCRRN
jgi:L-alanine-DL-glutamate epimerase-like enolase superfamily enzyme